MLICSIFFILFSCDYLLIHFDFISYLPLYHSNQSKLFSFNFFLQSFYLIMTFICKVFLFFLYSNRKAYIFNQFYWVLFTWKYFLLFLSFTKLAPTNFYSLISHIFWFALENLSAVGFAFRIGKKRTDNWMTKWKEDQMENSIARYANIKHHTQKN